ncbi:hypothetical protein [Rhodobacter aestuarii]|uniref:hypothetical protein n=1 Tax=Rhodobacter aestuarii TaxID=453582 RepID=UPI001589595C|nr:hypothetical protein [Rhodobacter aestuarii]
MAEMIPAMQQRIAACGAAEEGIFQGVARNRRASASFGRAKGVKRHGPAHGTLPASLPL